MKKQENEFTTVVGKEGFTRLVKPFRSDLDSSVEPKAQSDSQSSQTKYRNCVAHSYGFTLAETLITVAILGVVAAITIPAIINHQTESANRTKLKKAMTTYEKALNQMIIENDLKTNDAIAAFGEEGGLCANTTEYFKKVEGDGCRFKTADRIWWDITDIENPLVMLKDKYKEEEIAALKELAKKEDDREVFGMVGRLDDTIGVLRINDKGAETATPNKEYMAKLYNFSNNQKDETSCGPYCQASKMSACTGENKNCYEIDGSSIYYYDENGNQIMWKNGCTSGTTNCTNISMKSMDLNGGYKVHNDFGFSGCTNYDIDSCTDFCGFIKDDKDDFVAYWYDGTCSDINENDITCPLTIDELKALFK